MELGHYFTIVGTAVASAVPYALPFVPAPYKPVVTMAIAGAGALWHLWMTSPWA